MARLLGVYIEPRYGSLAMCAFIPIAPYLSLIDRLIALLQRREIKRREYFEKVVEPLYAEFTPIAEDYLRIWRRAAQISEATERPKNEDVEYITESRDKFLDSRARLRALVDVLKKDAPQHNYPTLNGFVSHLSSYFEPIDYMLFANPRELTPLGQVQLVFLSWSLGHHSVRVVRDCASVWVRNLEKRQRAIATSYMRLKIDSLGK